MLKFIWSPACEIKQKKCIILSVNLGAKKGYTAQGERQKAPIGVCHFITACRLPKEDTGLIKFDFRLNSNRK